MCYSNLGYLFSLCKIVSRVSRGKTERNIIATVLISPSTQRAAVGFGSRFNYSIKSPIEC